MLKLWGDYRDRHRTTHFGGSLVLGYVRSALTSLLANALILLREKHPKLAIKLVNTGGVSKHLAQEVAARKIDASFGVGPLRLPEEVQWRPYLLERYYVVAPRAFRGKTDEEMLSHGPYLRFRPHLLDETIIDREVHRRGIKVEAVMELDSYESTILMVEHDVGIGVVPESYLSRHRLARLHCVPFGTPPLTREMGIMVRPDSKDLHLVDLLWAALKEQGGKRLLGG